MADFKDWHAEFERGQRDCRKGVPFEFQNKAYNQGYKLERQRRGQHKDEDKDK